MNHLITKGMVVWVGKDPRGGYFYLTYYPDRSGRAICFQDSVPYLKRLGLTVTTHWKEESAARGYYGVYNCSYSKLSEVDYASGWIKISPVIEKIFETGMTNKTFAGLLKRDE